MQCQHHSTYSECLVRKVKLVLRFSTAQHLKASFGQSCVKGWTRWVSQMQEHAPEPNQQLFASAENFLGGKRFTCILWSLGGGKCYGNIGVGWGEDGDCPPELFGISVQECYGRNFHVLSVFDSLALSEEREQWEDPTWCPKWITIT